MCRSQNELHSSEVESNCASGQLLSTAEPGCAVKNNCTGHSANGQRSQNKLPQLRDSYFGGKGQDGVYQTIINEIPLHVQYIEGFLGNGSILKHKRLATHTRVFELNKQQLDNVCDDFGHSIFAHNECIINWLQGQLKLATWAIIKKTTFIYLDPPYLPETRRSKAKYKHELTYEDHVRLLDICNQLTTHLGCYIAISGYPSALYDEMLADWREVQFTSVDRGGNVREERLWCNYNIPNILHDDRYLGVNKSQRQAISRKIEGNVNKIKNFPLQVRARFVRDLAKHLTPDELKLMTQVEK